MPPVPKWVVLTEQESLDDEYVEADEQCKPIPLPPFPQPPPHNRAGVGRVPASSHGGVKQQTDVSCCLFNTDKVAMDSYSS